MYEDESTVAFLDIGQATIGHTHVEPGAPCTGSPGTAAGRTGNRSEAVELLPSKPNFLSRVKRIAPSIWLSSVNRKGCEKAVREPIACQVGIRSIALIATSKFRRNF
jgi:hypothetical protein